MPRHATLELQMNAADSDAEELAQLTAKLRRDLLQLDVDSVEHARSGMPPIGAKAVDVIAIGTLLVTLGRSVTRLTSVVRAVQGWVGTEPKRTVKMELDGDSIEISGASTSDQQRLVDLWIERHAEPEPA